MLVTVLSRLMAAATPTVAHSVRHWIYQLGGVGLIPLGLLDSSVVPIPGSMDVLTIILVVLLRGDGHTGLGDWRVRDF
jgi:hypothetical protein